MKKEIIKKEIFFIVQRSQGSGGQHVNRTNSAVTLQWYYQESQGLTDEEKSFISNKLASRINEDSVLYIRREIHRDQLQNKKEAIDELFRILEKCFFKPKKRVATRPSRSSVRERLKDKKTHSEKKANRSRRDWDE